MIDKEYMKIALIEAEKSLKTGDVPVGAVIVMNDRIIAKAFNTREKHAITIGHAEINTITKANKKLKCSRLDGATIYVTKEPCLMCMGAILSSHISKIVYGVDDLRFGTKDLAQNNNFNHKCEIIGGVMKEECECIIKNFFKKLRGNNESSRKDKNNTQDKRSRN